MEEKNKYLELSENLVSQNNHALIGTTSLKRYPNIRALKIMKREGLTTFYFSTRTNSDKIKQIKRRKKGCIYFYDIENFNNLLIEGKFTVLPNTQFGISELYKLDDNPYEFCTIKFETKSLYFYEPYKKHKISLT
jgi:general stress protein 26